jgi:hypothetical protein
LFFVINSIDEKIFLTLIFGLVKMTKRSRAHQIEDLGRSHIRLIFEKAGWTVENLSKDYGEDMLVRIFEGNHATQYTFYIQAKSTDHMVQHLSKSDKKVFFDFYTNHLLHWRRFWEPVILALWDAQNNITYWDYVQFNLDQNSISDEILQKQKTIRLKFPSNRILDSSSLPEIVNLTKRRHQRSHIEQNGAKHLEAVLEKELGLKVEYDGQMGFVIFPKGSFVQDPSGGFQLHAFGRMALTLEKMHKSTGLSAQELFEWGLTTLHKTVTSIEKGFRLVVKDKDGKEIKNWRTISELSYDLDWSAETEEL